MQTNLPYDGLKVAIPRLDRRNPDPSERKGDGKQEKRVSKACTNCRKRKVRCSGEQPTCLNCEASGSECIYDAHRRDKLRSAHQQTQSLVALLNDLRLRVSHEDQQNIDATLQGLDGDLASHVSTPTATSAKRRKQSSTTADEQEYLPGESLAPASVGSNQDLDLLDEDLLRSKESMKTGYAGKNSTVSWLKSLTREVKHEDGQPYGLPYGSAGADYASTVTRSEALHERRRQYKAQTTPPGTTDTTFYLDAESLKPDSEVDPSKLPPPEIAQNLFDIFMQTVYPSFPITSTSFDSEFRRLFEAMRSGTPFNPPNEWLALLNICFAIGSHYLSISGQMPRNAKRDHLVYLTRAVRLLDLKGHLLFATAMNLPTIQATGLLSFYYMTIGHVSRSWVMIGIAIRFALSLGLHLRNEDPSIEDSKKETLVRTWWSLHSIECLASSVTGRPSVLQPEDCTVALPQIHPGRQFSRPTQNDSTQPYSSGRRLSSTLSSNSSIQDSVRKTDGPNTYLQAHIGVGLITRKILSSLYAPRIATQAWSYIQNMIPQLLAELEEWRSHALPYEDGKLAHRSALPDEERKYMLLRFALYSNIMLITRPCLCRTERRIQDQSEASLNFNETTARRCVKAAQDMIDLLPDTPDPRRLFQNGPWWALVHNIMQSLTVLLLELSYQSTHMSNDSTTITPRIKKSIYWLRIMSKTDPASERAYKVVINILRQGGRQFRANVEHLLLEEEQDGGDADDEFGDGGRTPQATNKGLAKNNFAAQDHASEDHATQYSRNADVMGWMATPGYEGLLTKANAANTQATVLPWNTNEANLDPQLLGGTHQSQMTRTDPASMSHSQFYQPGPTGMPASESTQHLPAFGQQAQSTTNYPFFYQNPYSSSFAFANPFITSFDQVNLGNFMGGDHMAGGGGAYADVAYSGNEAAGDVPMEDQTLTSDFMAAYAGEGFMDRAGESDVGHERRGDGQ